MKKFMATISLLIMVGCVPHRPIVDLKTGMHNHDQYKFDLYECQQLAKQGINTAQGATTGALLGSLFGLGLGAALGGVLGDTKTGMAAGAIGGGATGLLKGAGEGAQQQKTIVNNCLRGRGYNPLY